jgi:hypothetical protein
MCDSFYLARVVILSEVQRGTSETKSKNLPVIVSSRAKHAETAVRFLVALGMTLVRESTKSSKRVAHYVVLFFMTPNTPTFPHVSDLGLDRVHRVHPRFRRRQMLDMAFTKCPNGFCSLSFWGRSFSQLRFHFCAPLKTPQEEDADNLSVDEFLAMNFRLAAVSYRNALRFCMVWKSSAKLCAPFVAAFATFARRRMRCGLLPVVEWFRGDGKEIVSNACIGATGNVRSVLLFHRGPIEKQVDRARRSSRTSVALLQIVLQDLYGVRSDSTVLSPELETMCATTTALY